MRAGKKLAAALAALADGYWPIPLRPGTKLPHIKWKPYQDRAPTEAEVRLWWSRWPDADIGAICGHAAGLWTWDADSPEQEAALRAAFQDTPARIVRTRRGIQIHVKPDQPRQKRDGILPKLDFKGDRSITVLPPSKDKSWEAKDAPLALSPQALLALLDAPSGNGTKKRSARIAPTDRVPEGRRDTSLFRHGCFLREVYGWDEAHIYDELARINRDQGDPPEDDAVVREKATRAALYQPSEGDRLPNDLGNARRLVRWHGEDLRYVADADEWRVWDGTCWARDVMKEREHWAKDVVRTLYQQAATDTDKDRGAALGKFASRCATDARMRSMLSLASTEPELVVRARDFNADPWLLNVLNGTLDLRTGALRPHARADMLTALAPVTFDPAATCPRWERFLQEVTGGDAALATYLQRITGYTLTGDTSEQCIFMPNGPGANGKSTFLETIRQALFGPDYARDTPLSTFLVGRDDTVRADIARLHGARFVTASETGEGRQLDEVLVKRLTGGDTMTARLLYRAHFEFVPQMKLFLSTNHRPEVRGTDEAIWRRVRLLPFTVNFPPAARDKHLVETLVAEGSGILNWALAGCRAWQAARGLTEPDAVRQATSNYRREQDTLGEFLRERCTTHPGARVLAADIREAYEHWCRTEESGVALLKGRDFRRRMEEHGLTFLKSNSLRWWVGVEVNRAAF